LRGGGKGWRTGGGDLAFEGVEGVAFARITGFEARDLKHAGSDSMCGKCRNLEGVGGDGLDAGGVEFGQEVDH
jgi:hypothetical protein